MQNRTIKKSLVIGIIFLFIGMSVTTSTGKIDTPTTKTIVYKGSLLGYVNDTSGNPIEGALVRVYFHETYEGSYTDSTGYYHVINIPICYCMKNATCSKEDYKTEWVLLGIYENTKYDFVLTPSSPYGMYLSCDDPYQNVKQGETATFIVEITNTGTLDDIYDVIAGSIEDIICKVNGVNADQYNPYEFTLSSGESTTFEVSAEVWESVPVDEWSVIIEADSQNNSEISDELILNINVQKKNKAINNNSFFLKFLERFPLLKQLFSLYFT